MANVWLQRCSRADVRLNLLTSSCFIDVIKNNQAADLIITWATTPVQRRCVRVPKPTKRALVCVLQAYVHVFFTLSFRLFFGAAFYPFEIRTGLEQVRP